MVAKQGGTVGDDAHEGCVGWMAVAGRIPAYGLGAT
jgi:hypothetical protein